jgi:hypothetical protein
MQISTPFQHLLADVGPFYWGLWHPTERERSRKPIVGDMENAKAGIICGKSDDFPARQGKEQLLCSLLLFFPSHTFFSSAGD